MVYLVTVGAITATSHLTRTMPRYPGCDDADTSFGPVVPSTCRGGFDFTLLFEQIFFGFLPATALLVAATFRLWHLRHARTVASGALLQFTKQVGFALPNRRGNYANLGFRKCAACGYVITQLATLILWSTPATFKTRLSVVSAVINLTASLSIAPLSLLEGKRSLRPSLVINVYLLGSSLLDVVQVRTLWLMATYDFSLRRVAIALSVGLGLKIALLVVEAIPKKILTSGEPISREESAGVYSLRTFWWLNSILWLGRMKRLQPADLYLIDPGLKTVRYSSQLIDAWNKGSSHELFSFEFSLKIL